MHNFMYRSTATGPQILIRGIYALKLWVISSTLRSIYPCVVIIGQEAGWVTESGEEKNPCPTRESIHSHKIIASHFIYWDTFIHRGIHLQSSKLFVSKCPLRGKGLQQPEHYIRGFETHLIEGVRPCMSALCLYVGKYRVWRCTVFKSYQLHQTITASKLSIKWQGSRAWSVLCYRKDNPKCLTAHNTPVCNLNFCWADLINLLVYYKPYCFILLMAGTLSVYHWPMRPIKVKHREKKITLKKKRK